MLRFRILLVIILYTNMFSSSRFSVEKANETALSHSNGKWIVRLGIVYGTACIVTSPGPNLARAKFNNGMEESLANPSAKKTVKTYIQNVLFTSIPPEIPHISIYITNLININDFKKLRTSSSKHKKLYK